METYGASRHRSAETYLSAIYGTGVVANLEAALNAEFKKSVSPNELRGQDRGHGREDRGCEPSGDHRRLRAMGSGPRHGG